MCRHLLLSSHCFDEYCCRARLKDVKLLCEAEVASSCVGLIWCRVCHNTPFNSWVITNVFRSPNGLRQFGVVNFVTVLKALIMVVAAGFELRLATAIIMPCSASCSYCCFIYDGALATPSFQWAIGFISAIIRWYGVIGLSPVI